MKRKLKPSGNTSVKALKRRFDAAHREGMDALNRKDYDGFESAIKQEGALIKEQRRLIETLKPKVPKRKTGKKR